jgi:ubiquitin-conjugating enzyme E2 S
MRRLMRELLELKNSPPEGIRVVTSEDNMLDVTGIIEGPGKVHNLCRIVSGG